jgi:hypothetical protein
VFEEAYLSLTGRMDEGATKKGHADFIWIKSVSMKVSVFSWHFLMDRLPTKENLIKRRIVNGGSQFCSFDCGFICEGSHRMWCGVQN